MHCCFALHSLLICVYYWGVITVNLVKVCACICAPLDISISSLCIALLVTYVYVCLFKLFMRNITVGSHKIFLIMMYICTFKNRLSYFYNLHATCSMYKL